jgi:hypothetical protein
VSVLVASKEGVTIRAARELNASEIGMSSSEPVFTVPLKTFLHAYSSSLTKEATDAVQKCCSDDSDQCQFARATAALACELRAGKKSFWHAYLHFLDKGWRQVLRESVAYPPVAECSYGAQGPFSLTTHGNEAELRLLRCERVELCARTSTFNVRCVQ